MKKRINRIFLINIPLIIIFLGVVFPIYWTLATSFKQESTILDLPLRYLPAPFTFENYTYIWENMGFDRYLLNSTVTTLVSTVISTFIALFGGYAISRYKFKGKRSVYITLLISQMFPGVALMIPLFEIFNNMGFVNSPMSLILTYITVRIPFCMIMISGFVSGISPTLEEAAQIDGCSILGSIFKIVIPTITPGIVAAAAFSFVSSWNEFEYAFIFISDEKFFTLPVGLRQMQGEFTVAYGSLAAGCVMAMVPCILMFAYIQRYLIPDLTAGSVKG